MQIWKNLKSNDLRSLGKVLSLIALISLFWANTSTAEEGLLFQFHGKKYYKDDLSLAAKQRLTDTKFVAFERFHEIYGRDILERYLEREMARTKKSRQELEDAWFEVELTDEEKKQSRINQWAIYVKKRKEKELALIEKLQKEGNYQANLKRPNSIKVDISHQGYPTIGGNKPKVEFVMFVGFQTCPNCRNILDTMDLLNLNYPKDIKITYMIFDPYPNPRSYTAMKAALCSHSQNKLFDFLEITTLNKMTPRKLKRFKKEESIDGDQFSDCMDSDETKNALEHSFAEAKRLGIYSSPVVYMNNVKIQSVKYFDLERKIGKLIRGS